MRKVFSFSFKGKDLKSVFLAAVRYALIYAAYRILISLFMLPDAVGVALHLLGHLLLLYSVSGTVVAVLYACDCLEK